MYPRKAADLERRAPEADPAAAASTDAMAAATANFNGGEPPYLPHHHHLHQRRSQSSLAKGPGSSSPPPPALGASRISAAAAAVAAATGLSDTERAIRERYLDAAQEHPHRNQGPSSSRHRWLPPPPPPPPPPQSHSRPSNHSPSSSSALLSPESPDGGLGDKDAVGRGAHHHPFPPSHSSRYSHHLAGSPYLPSSSSTSKDRFSLYDPLNYPFGYPGGGSGRGRPSSSRYLDSAVPGAAAATTVSPSYYSSTVQPYPRSWPPPHLPAVAPQHQRGGRDYFAPPLPPPPPPPPHLSRQRSAGTPPRHGQSTFDGSVGKLPHTPPFGSGRSGGQVSATDLMFHAHYPELRAAGQRHHQQQHPHFPLHHPAYPPHLHPPPAPPGASHHPSSYPLRRARHHSSEAHALPPPPPAVARSSSSSSAPSFSRAAAETSLSPTSPREDEGSEGRTEEVEEGSATPRPTFPPHFSVGSLIQLTSGDLKKVEELTTEDFLQCAELSDDVMISRSEITLLEVPPSPQSPAASEEPKSPTAGSSGSSSSPSSAQATTASPTVVIGFAVGEQRLKVTVEADVEHPFFVFGKGWSSFSPDRTMTRYRLPCRQLRMGDECVSLTHRELMATATAVDAATAGEEGEETTTVKREAADVDEENSMMPPPPPPTSAPSTTSRSSSSSSSPTSSTGEKARQFTPSAAATTTTTTSGADFVRNRRNPSSMEERDVSAEGNNNGERPPKSPRDPPAPSEQRKRRAGADGGEGGDGNAKDPSQGPCGEKPEKRKKQAQQVGDGDDQG